MADLGSESCARSREADGFQLSNLDHNAFIVTKFELGVDTLTASAAMCRQRDRAGKTIWQRKTSGVMTKLQRDQNLVGAVKPLIGKNMIARMKQPLRTYAERGLRASVMKQLAGEAENRRVVLAHVRRT